MFTKEELEKLEQLKSKIANDGILEKINKDMFSKASEVVRDTGEGTSKVTQESVHIADGVKTTTRKVIVNGMVVSTETIQEKDGVKIKHSEVVKEPIFEEETVEPNVEEYIKVAAFEDDEFFEDDSQGEDDDDEPDMVEKDEL